MVSFKEYQEFTNKTAKYPGQGSLSGLIYATLGANGEAGEISNKLKKVLRDNNGVLTEEIKKALRHEVSDVLWYVSQLAAELDVDLEYIASINMEKLQSRLDRGVIQGSGDNR